MQHKNIERQQEIVRDSLDPIRPDSETLLRRINFIGFNDV